MKIRCVTLVTATFLVLTGYAPAYCSSTWAITLGGTGADYAQAVQPTSDGGSIMAGYTTNSFGTVGNDAWVVKQNADGSIAWQKTYGGTGDDRAYSVQQTSDGGYVVAGFTNGGSEAWVLKLDSGGAITWQKTYSMGVNSTYPSIQQTDDSGYIVSLAAFSGGVGDVKIVLLKLDSTGNVSWKKYYGGNGATTSRPYAVRQTSDKGYIVAGYTTALGSGGNDAWILKLDVDGNITWHNAYGGTGDDKAYSIQQTIDGGYVVAGKSGSSSTAWVLKLDSGGGVSWQKTYTGTNATGTNATYGAAVQQTADGGYIVTSNKTIPSSITANPWIAKLTTDGAISWQKIYGSIGDSYDVRQTSDGEYVVAGRITNGSKSEDALVLKLDQSGSIGGCAKITTSSAVVQTATGAVTTSLITPVSGTETPKDSAATVGNTTAIPGLVCFGTTFSLGTSLDNNSLIFTVDAFPWTGVADPNAVGGSNAQSGSIADNGVSALTTSIQGPGQLSFQWEISSEGAYDYLRFYIDDVEKMKISGTVGWATLTYPITAGTHTLKWAYTKDGSTVAGSDAGWVDNVQFVPDAPQTYNLTVTKSGSGSGTVTTNVPPGTLSWSDTTGTASYPASTSVTLTSTPEISSAFSGWSGDCINSATGTCTLSMNANHGAGTSFAMNDYVRIGIGTTPYGTLNLAFAAAQTGDVIKARGIVLTEDLIINRSIPMTLLGGYASDFGSISGYTTLYGKLTVASGSIVVSGLVIK